MEARKYVLALLFVTAALLVIGCVWMFDFAPTALNNIFYASMSKPEFSGVTTTQRLVHSLRWTGVLLCLSFAGTVVYAKRKLYPDRTYALICLGHLAVLTIWITTSMYVLWPYFEAREILWGGRGSMF